MFMCVGLHAYTVSLCVWEKEHVCVCTDSVDRSSWKEKRGAEKFLWSLTITNSWKKAWDWKRPMAEEFLGVRGCCVRKWGCERLKEGLYTELRLFMSSWYTLESHPLFICPHLSTSSVLSAFTLQVSTSSDKLHQKWKCIYILTKLF